MEQTNLLLAVHSQSWSSFANPTHPRGMEVRVGLCITTVSKQSAEDRYHTDRCTALQNKWPKTNSTTFKTKIAVKYISKLPAKDIHIPVIVINYTVIIIQTIK